LKSEALLRVGLVVRMKSVVNQGEQILEVFVEISSITAGVRERHLFQIAKRLQAVTEPVGLFFDRQDFQLTATGLGIKAEQQPVDEGQGLALELSGRDLVTAIIQLRQ